jgi:uncharacterized membrane protein
MPDLLAIASESATTHSSGFAFLAEQILHQLASVIKVFLEFIAIVIVVIATLQILRKILERRRPDMTHTLQQAIRLELGLALALSLEFLLAADIVGTAISPTWDTIARLAAITGIRTFLNFFLQKEIRELEKMNDRKNDG